MKSKKILIGILIFLIVVSITAVAIVFSNKSVAKEDKNHGRSSLYEEWLKLPEEERKNTIAPIPFNVNYKSNQTKGSKDSTTRGRVIPEQYDLRDQIDVEVKDQETTGECWAFSANSQLEILLALQDEEYEFSERHMEFDTVSEFIDGINESGLNRAPGDGGYRSTAFTYYSRGSGPVSEDDMPFISNESKISLLDLPTNIAIKKVDDMIYFPTIIKERDEEGNLTYKDANYDNYTEEQVLEIRNSIKQHIMEYGAVVINYCADGGDGANIYTEDSECWPNHAVALIGWDDTYDKDNFTYYTNPPEHDGAYILLNSWGTQYGNEGFFYISYDDVWVEAYVNGVTSISDIEYDSLYQHDISEIFGYEATKYGANVFTCEQNEKLTELMIASTSEQQCNIYINPSSDDLDITKLTKVKSNVSLKPGYNTIKLDSSIQLNKGNKFSVIVELIGEVDGLGAEFIIDGAWGNVTSNEGESFVSSDGSNWNDLYNEDFPENLSIKAFTKHDQENVKIREVRGKAYERIGGSFAFVVEAPYIENENTLDVNIYKNNVDVTDQFSVYDTKVKGNGAYILIEALNDVQKGEYDIEISTPRTEGGITKFVIDELDERYIPLQFNDETFIRILDDLIEDSVVDYRNYRIYTTREEIDNLEEIMIDLNDSRSEYIDLSGIEQFNGLRRLILSNISNLDLTPIANIQNLEELSIKETSIESDLSIINEFDKLKALCLSYIYIKNDHQEQHFLTEEEIGFIKNLSLLEKLDLGNNNINNIDFLEGLKNLKELYLNENTKYDENLNVDIIDIEGISQLNTLEVLALDFNEIDNISEIYELNNLRELYLGNIADPKVKYGSEEVYYIEEIDMDAISQLSNLEVLSLPYIPSITESELSKISNLNRLKSLDVRGCNIGSLDVIKDLDLEALYIGNIYHETDKYREEETPSIIIIYYEMEFFGNNHFTDLSALANMKNLAYLEIEGVEGIQTLNGLENANNLQYIYLTHSNLRDATSLEGKNIVFLSEDNSALESNLSYQTVEDTFEIDGEDLSIPLPKILQQIFDENSSMHYFEGPDQVIEFENCMWEEYGKSIKIIDSNQEDAKIAFGLVGEEYYAASGVCEYRYTINLVKSEELTGTVNSINIKYLPKTEYLLNEDLNIEEAIITAEYSNGKTVDIFMSDPEVEVKNYDKTKVGKQTVTVEYKGKTTTFDVDVISTLLSKIEITNGPSRTNYYAGQRFDNSGMTVEAIYDNGMRRVITNYVVTDGENLKANQTKVTISYTEGEITKTAEQAITVLSNNLTKIEITREPSKKEYIEGQSFDDSGMTVEAEYENRLRKVITNYSVIDGENLKANQTKVTISYTEDEITKTAEQTITVIPKNLSKIEITKEPTKKEYVEGESFDNTGMTVEATYDNGTKSEITNYIVTDGENLKVDQTKVTISYTEGEITKTAEQKITVTAKNNEVITEKEGDINEDGKVDIEDIMIINLYRLGKKNLDEDTLNRADVNKDKVVDIKDIMRINLYRLGKSKTL